MDAGSLPPAVVSLPPAILNAQLRANEVANDCLLRGQNCDKATPEARRRVQQAAVDKLRASPKAELQQKGLLKSMD